MTRCLGKTASGNRCHNYTRDSNQYCWLHQIQAPTDEQCPVCFEPLSGLDLLSCGHAVHTACVQTAADVLQDHLAQEGYPAYKYGKCPICRADQVTIIAKPPSWYDQIELTGELMRSLLDALVKGKGWIDPTSIHPDIVKQMPNAHSTEQLLFANAAASFLWISGYPKLPRRMCIRQLPGGGFRQQIFF